MPDEFGRVAMIMVITPEGVPLVRELNKPSPIYWKLPAGGCKGNETLAQCAARELREETGINVPEKSLVFVTNEIHKDHILGVFGIRLPALPKLKDRGDDGEMIGVFPVDEIVQLVDFHPDHRRVVAKVIAALPA